MKENLVEKLRKKHRRRELIILRRSELGKRLFGKSQRSLLKKVGSDFVWSLVLNGSSLELHMCKRARNH